MTQINRRELMVAAAVTACACCLADPLDILAGTTGNGMTLDVGLLSAFSSDGLTDKWMKKPTQVALIRHDGKLYATTTICTHKGCTVKADKSSGGVFACPCHHAGFDIDGNVTHGPAAAPLVRYAISVNASNHVIVDKSKSFQPDKWNDPASFIEMKSAATTKPS